MHSRLSHLEIHSYIHSVKVRVSKSFENFTYESLPRVTFALIIRKSYGECSLHISRLSLR